MNALDTLLDLSIVKSFDQSGFERHRRLFDPGDLQVDLSGKVILVTGANSGLGEATSTTLARLGAEVWLLCRNRKKGEDARTRITELTGNDRIRVAIVDVADQQSIGEFVHGWSTGPVDGLIHNAGVLLDRREVTADGLERTLATHVVGPFALTWALRPHLERSEDARVVTVSSGGMYTQRLELTDLEWKRRPFDGVVAYAQAKRSQVILNQLWAERTRGSGIAFHAMHPGWADTPGVRQSLPRFYRWTRGRLRSPQEGADTIVWLAASRSAAFCNGCFWFDRQRARTHVFPWTRESHAEREALWDFCLSHLSARVRGPFHTYDDQ